jgi:Prokaryotic dksA/traR C4-type zinc finger
MSSTTRPCEICRQPIDAERLEVLPETRLCTEHAKKIRKFGGEFIMTAIQERTSKAGSLKRNYGGVSTSKRRNHEGIERLREEYEEEQK